MCLVFFYISDQSQENQKKQQNPKKIKFAIIFNREENYKRQSLPLDKFKEDENIYGGRDLQEGGTWFGINRETKNISFLTNRFPMKNLIKATLNLYKFLGVPKFPKSRGTVIKDFIKSDFYEEKENQILELTDFSEKCQQRRQDYIMQQRFNSNKFGPCNLIFGNLESLEFYSLKNYENQKLQKISPGFHTLCSYNEFNGKKLKKEQIGVQNFQEIIKEFDQKQNQNVENVNLDNLFQEFEEMATNKTKYGQKLLNGMVEIESSIFIEKYQSKIKQTETGTKSITMAVLLNDGQLEMRDIFFDENGIQSKHQHIIGNINKK